MICWCSLAGTEACDNCKNNTEIIQEIETVTSLQELSDKIRKLGFDILT